MDAHALGRTQLVRRTHPSEPYRARQTHAASVRRTWSRSDPALNRTPAHFVGRAALDRTPREIGRKLRRTQRSSDAANPDAALRQVASVGRRSDAKLKWTHGGRQTHAANQTHSNQTHAAKSDTRLLRQTPSNPDAFKSDAKSDALQSEQSDALQSEHTLTQIRHRASNQTHAQIQGCLPSGTRLRQVQIDFTLEHTQLNQTRAASVRRTARSVGPLVGRALPSGCLQLRQTLQSVPRFRQTHAASRQTPQLKSERTRSNQTHAANQEHLHSVRRTLAQSGRVGACVRRTRFKSDARPPSGAKSDCRALKSRRTSGHLPVRCVGLLPSDARAKSGLHALRQTRWLNQTHKSDAHAQLIRNTR
jgi:hypothetical protein